MTLREFSQDLFDSGGVGEAEAGAGGGGGDAQLHLPPEILQVEQSCQLPELRTEDHKVPGQAGIILTLSCRHSPGSCPHNRKANSIESLCRPLPRIGEGQCSSHSHNLTEIFQNEINISSTLLVSCESRGFQNR